ncbi:hypothetical protein CsSME_00030662 [Camellia sinensis var. sinensis]
MLYILIMQPTMMSSVAGIGKIRFRDTCAKAKRFFRRRKTRKAEKEKNFVKRDCQEIKPNNVDTEVKPVAVRGNRSKSVLFDACILVKELDKLVEERKWERISKVWVEMSCYAAGQLITLVWLLMAHFGLGDQFQIREGHAREKLIVEK